MRLFFDQDWFDDRLNALGLSRNALAEASGMTVDEVDMVFEDKRQISASEINAFADALSVNPNIVAKYCGVADLELEAAREQSLKIGPLSMNGNGELPVTRDMIMGLHERIDRIERLLEMVLTSLEVKR